MSQMLLTFRTLQICNIYAKTELKVLLIHVDLHTGPPICFRTNPTPPKAKRSLSIDFSGIRLAKWSKQVYLICSSYLAQFCCFTYSCKHNSSQTG